MCKVLVSGRDEVCVDCESLQAADLCVRRRCVVGLVFDVDALVAIPVAASNASHRCASWRITAVKTWSR